MKMGDVQTGGWRTGTFVTLFALKGWRARKQGEMQKKEGGMLVPARHGSSGNRVGESLEFTFWRPRLFSGSPQFSLTSVGSSSCTGPGGDGLSLSESYPTIASYDGWPKFETTSTLRSIPTVRMPWSTRSTRSASPGHTKHVHHHSFAHACTRLEHYEAPSSSVSLIHGSSTLALTGVSATKANNLLGASYEFYRHIKMN